VALVDDVACPWLRQRYCDPSTAAGCCVIGPDDLEEFVDEPDAGDVDVGGRTSSSPTRLV